jgi:hypothetical protein
MIEVQEFPYSLKTKQAQDVFEGKTKSYDFELGIYSFASKLNDLLTKCSIDNPIKNAVLNIIDYETDQSLEVVKKEMSKLESMLVLSEEYGFLSLKIDLNNTKTYKVKFSNSRIYRLLMLINILEKVTIQAISLEASSMITSSIRSNTIYTCQNKIRRVLNIVYKKIDDILKTPNIEVLLEASESSFSEKIKDHKANDDLFQLLGCLDEVKKPIREL